MSFQAMNYAAFSCSTTKVKESKKKKERRVTSRLWTLQVFCQISIINPLYRQKKARAAVL